MRLTVTLIDARLEDLTNLAAKGITLEERGRDVSLTFTAATAGEALERLGLIAELLAPKR